jgi:hypothetical protein
MKTGVIVYAAGNPPPEWSDTDEKLVRHKEPFADRVNVITRFSGHLDVHEAWFDLVVRGMERIIMIMALFSDAGHLEFTGRELRLRG